jgi:hypothetical protein
MHACMSQTGAECKAPSLFLHCPASQQFGAFFCSTGFSPISGRDGDPSPEGPRRLRHQGRQVVCVGRLSLCLSVSLSLCLSLCLYMQTDRLFVMNGRDSPGYRRLRQRVALHFRGHHRACTWERACQAANVHDVSDRHGWHRNPVFVSTSIRPDVTIQGSPNQYP